MSETKKTPCGATTIKTGTKCLRNAIEGSAFCAQHKDYKPEVVDEKRARNNFIGRTRSEAADVAVKTAQEQWEKLSPQQKQLEIAKLHAFEQTKKEAQMDVDKTTCLRLKKHKVVKDGKAVMIEGPCGESVMTERAALYTNAKLRQYCTNCAKFVDKHENQTLCKGLTGKKEACTRQAVEDGFCKTHRPMKKATA